MLEVQLKHSTNRNVPFCIADFSHYDVYWTLLHIYVYAEAMALFFVWEGFWGVAFFLKLSRRMLIVVAWSPTGTGTENIPYFQIVCKQTIQLDCILSSAKTMCLVRRSSDYCKNLGDVKNSESCEICVLTMLPRLTPDQTPFPFSLP